MVSTMSTTVMTLPSYMAGFLHEIGPPGGGVYSYVSYPSAVLPNRPKYRNEKNNNDDDGPINIMHDKRVVRGNTYAVNQRVPMRFNVASTNDDVIHQRRGYVRKRVLPTINGESPNGKLHKNRMNFTAGGLSNSAGSASTGKSSSSNGDPNGHVTTDARYTAARARVRKRLAQFQSNRVNPSSRKGEKGERAAVDGRRHRDMQTDKWLEEIKDRVPEVEIGVQTDAVKIAPASRDDSDPVANGDGGGPIEAFSSPPPPSNDAWTQIEVADPDLFVFDEEVGIVLEAVVGKTLEQSLLEVIDEEEKAVEEKMAKAKLRSSL